eukprot:1212912-Prymnesium_polylepis.2
MSPSLAVEAHTRGQLPAGCSMPKRRIRYAFPVIAAANKWLVWVLAAANKWLVWVQRDSKQAKIVRCKGSAESIGSEYKRSLVWRCERAISVGGIAALHNREGDEVPFLRD